MAFRIISGVAQSPLADKQQSANVRYSRGDRLQRVGSSSSIRCRQRLLFLEVVAADAIADDRCGANRRRLLPLSLA